MKADLTGASFKEAHIAGVDFREAAVQGVDFSGCFGKDAALFDPTATSLSRFTLPSIRYEDTLAR